MDIRAVLRIADSNQFMFEKIRKLLQMQMTGICKYYRMYDLHRDVLGLRAPTNICAGRGGGEKETKIR
jgi:hypothetical protein